MADLEYEPGVVYSVSGVAELEARTVSAIDTEFAAARVAAGEDGVMLDGLKDYYTDERTTMQPHEERVVNERNELDDKIGKLTDFIGSSKIYKSLPEPERSRLQVQLHYMQGYSHILHERIKNFP